MNQHLNFNIHRMIIIVMSISIHKHPQCRIQRGESSFVCNQRLVLRTMEALPCLRICEGLPEPSLLENAKRTKISRVSVFSFRQ